MNDTILMHYSHLYAHGYRNNHSIDFLISHCQRDKKERLVT